MEYTVTKCDGPRCEVQRDDTNAPRSFGSAAWYTLHREGDGFSPWHFHTTECLENWAVKKNA